MLSPYLPGPVALKGLPICRWNEGGALGVGALWPGTAAPSQTACFMAVLPPVSPPWLSWIPTSDSISDIKARTACFLHSHGDGPHGLENGPIVDL